MNKNILIASSTTSKDEYLPVAESLSRRGFSVTIYNSDMVLSGKDLITANVTEDGDTLVTYNGVDISNSELGALWYRKVADFNKPGDLDDKAKSLLLMDEVSSFHQDIWTSFYDKDKWLNSPEDIVKTSNKLGQLVAARSVGFSIPETLVSSDWDAITSRLLTEKEVQEIIVKMARGVIIIDGEERALPTTRLGKDKLDYLKERTYAFPGFYQPFKEKFREWRVTVIGEEVFPVAIYTDEEAKDDWRNYQTSSHIKFVPEELEDDTADKCIKFLGKYGLRFGAFDLIEGSNGSMTFLECNANGQYYAFEQRFGLPISNAIIQELIKIAQNT